MNLTNWVELGILPIRHHVKEDVALRLRNVPLAARQGGPDKGFGIGRDEFGITIPEMKDLGGSDDTLSQLDCASIWELDDSGGDPGGPSQANPGTTSGPSVAAPAKSDRELPGWTIGGWPASISTPAPDPDTNVPALGGLMTTSGPPPKPKARLIRKQDWKQDTRFKEKEVSLPPGMEGLPKNWPVIIIAGTEERSQEMLAFPVGGLLCAPYHGGHVQDGSLVYDAKNDDTLDPIRKSRLQSILRVGETPVSCAQSVLGKAGGHFLALQLGTPLKGFPGLGLYAEDGPTGGQAGPGGTVSTGSTQGTAARPPQIISPLSRRASGPLHPGFGALDPHYLGKNSDGDEFSAGGISTDAYIIRSPLKTGPANWEEGGWPNPGEAPIPVKVHAVWRPKVGHKFVCGTRLGVWDWYSSTFFYSPPPPYRPRQPQITNPPPLTGPHITGPDLTEPRIPPDMPGMPVITSIPGIPIDDPGVPAITNLNPGIPVGTPTGGGATDGGSVPAVTEINPGITDNPNPAEDPFSVPVVDFDPTDPGAVNSPGVQTFIDLGATSGEPPTDGPTDGPSQDGDPKACDDGVGLRFLSTWMEVASPSMLMQPQFYGTQSRPDLRNQRFPTPEQVRNRDRQTPIVGSLFAVGAQSGDGWKYTQKPSTVSKYGPGTASGGLWAAPAEFDPCQFFDDGTVPTTISSFTFGITPWAKLALGTPSKGGGVVSGFNVYPKSDGTQILVDTVDSNGNVTATGELWPNAGGTVPSGRLINTTSPLTGGGDLSADRTIALGTVPVTKGGTGDTTLAAHGVLIGEGTGAVAVTGTGTTGQVLTSNGASADPTFQTPSTTVTPGSFGDGSDGAVTIDGTAYSGLISYSGTTATLLKDMNATTLVVTNTYTLKTNGFLINATTSITVNTGGTIADVGNNASGTGGVTGGAVTTVNSIGGGSSGGNGLSSFNNGNVGNVTGTNQNVGGGGGAGGNAGTKTGGAGGSSTVPANYGSFRSGPAVQTCIFVGARGATSVATILAMFGGTGGGSGASSAAGLNFSGAGGGGGGVMNLGAPSIVNNGTISVAGGNGGTGFNGGGANDYGGGGGGGGGFIITRGTFSGTSPDVSGGLKGTPGSGAGAAGVDGSVGTWVQA